MVDFQNENTTSTPPTDLLKILIIQRRNDIIDAIESYNKLKFLHTDVPDNIIRARMLSLYYELGHALQRWLGKELGDFKDFKKTMAHGDIKEVIELFEKINEHLDIKKITRVDTRQSFDRKDTEEEN